MYTIKYTTAFKRSYRLMKKRGQNLALRDEVWRNCVEGNRWTKSTGIMC